MSDREPVKRLLVDDGATALERDLLGAGMRMKAPADIEGRVWGALGTRLASTSAGAAGAAIAAKSATKATAAGGALKAGAAAALKTKLVIAAFVVAGAGTTATIVATQPPPVHATFAATPAPALAKVKSEARTVAAHRAEPVATATSPNEMPNAAPPVASPSTPRAHLATAPPAAAKVVETTKSLERAQSASDTAPAPEAAAPSTPAQTALRSDALAIKQARSALQAGDVGGAEQSLATLSRGTMLAPERDALRVRIAAARGDHARAGELADAFLRTYPDSPLAPQVARHASK